ncbi:4Fe-4S binding protein [Nonomuraea sp. NPDC002799]
MARIPGVGLAKGLSITLRHMLRKSVTQQYPEVKPALPPRSRGVIALVEENCTSCMLCARECPDWCIYIDSHKETIPAPEGGRPRQRNVLDRFAIDFALCMYCGICIEVCPFDALFWSPEFEYAEGDIRNLLHEKDKLASWTQTVPPPPAHDPGAELPKELTATPRRPAADRAPRTSPAAPAARQTTQASPPPSATTPKSQTPSTGTSDAAPPAGTSDASPSTGTSDAAPSSGTGGTIARTGDTEATSGTTPSTGTTEASPSSGETPSSTGTEQAATPSTDTGETPPTAAPRQPDPTVGHPRSTPATGSSDVDPTVGHPQPAPTTGPSGADPTPNAPEEAPKPAGRERPRRPMTNVRGIRPPGALPPHPQDTPSEQADQPQEQASSTGPPPPEELSTASGEPKPEPEPEEQTSAASPRRRRMADPRSIQPPGRLGPDDTRESEEES